MKKLSTRTNLIPVVAKADMLTEIELHNFKNLVRTTLEKHEIETCQSISNEKLVQEINMKIPCQSFPPLPHHWKLIAMEKSIEFENILGVY